MIQFQPKVWILTLCYLCATLPAFAQVREQVEVQFICFPKIQNAEPVELLIAPGKTIEVELPSNQVSKSYRVDRLSQWALGKSVPGPDGKTVFKPYGKAPAIAAKKQFILVVSKGANYSDGLELTVMNGNRGEFNGGKYLIFNASKIEIAGVLGDSKFKIKPNKMVMIAPEPNEEKRGRKFLHSHLYFRKGDAAQPFYSSTWRFNEGVRNFIFIYHDPNNDRLRTHSIRDYLP